LPRVMGRDREVAGTRKDEGGGGGGSGGQGKRKGLDLTALEWAGWQAARE